MKMLLAAGADVNATSGKAEDQGITPLMAVALDDGADMVQLFLDKGADINARTAGGETALSLAKWSELKDKEAVIRKLEAARAKTCFPVTPRHERAVARRDRARDAARNEDHRDDARGDDRYHRGR